jgi:hypothetical protein
MLAEGSYTWAYFRRGRLGLVEEEGECQCVSGRRGKHTVSMCACGEGRSGGRRLHQGCQMLLQTDVAWNRAVHEDDSEDQDQIDKGYCDQATRQRKRVS